MKPAVHRRIDASMRVLVGLGILLVLLTGAGVAVHEWSAVDLGSDTRLMVFVGIGIAAALVYMAAVALMLRFPRGSGIVWIVLGFALALRLIVLAEPPFLSTDLYRYIWDGRVQIEGVNPYRYIPSDPALIAFRDDAVFPRINRVDYAPTIYPPVAQLVFYAVAYVSQTPLAIKVAMVLFEIVAVVTALHLLKLAGLGPARILIYAWNPLPVWEFAGNGHIDAAALGLVALAILAHVRRRRALTGVILGAAVAVKFLPVVLAPALWRRWDWRMPAAMVAAIAAFYFYYADVGWGVIGFLPGYAADEGLANGAGIYWLAAASRFVALPEYAGSLWLGAAALGLVGLGVALAFAGGEVAAPQDDIVASARSVCLMATALMVVVTPHYPWYFAWLSLPACFVPIRSVVFLASIAMLLHLDLWHDRIVWPSLVYLPFIVLAVLDYRRGAITFAIPVHATTGRSR